MSNVLVICIEPIPSAILGVYEPLVALPENIKLMVRFVKTIEIRKADLDWCDIIVLVRSTEELELRVAKACKKAGKYLVYYLDDDLLNLPEIVSDARYYENEALRCNLIKIIQTCDFLWAVNPKIIEKYGAYVKKPIITKGPAMLLSLGPVPEKSETPLIIGFAGSKDHAKTLDTVAGDAIRRISFEYRDRVRFEFLGARPKVIDDIKGARYISYIFDPIEYRKFMYNSNWSIGLAPLPCEDFFTHKYYNKFLEYGAIGCAGIYTDIEPFKFIVNDSENGVLCKNTPDDWYMAIKKMIDNSELRRYIVQNARSLLESGFTELSVGYEALRAIPELAGSSDQSSMVRIFGLSPVLNQIILWYNKFLRFMREHGIKAIFIIPFLAIRKLLKMLKIIKGW